MRATRPLGLALGLALALAATATRADEPAPPTTGDVGLDALIAELRSRRTESDPSDDHPTDPTDPTDPSDPTDSAPSDRIAIEPATDDDIAALVEAARRITPLPADDRR